MLYVVCLSLSVAVGSYAAVLTDGFEGPWDLPGYTFNFNFDGDGFDEDWYVDNVEWTGDNQFNMYAETEIKTEGQYSQAANAYMNDGNPRDLYLVRLVTGVEANKTYTIKLDYRYDTGDPGSFSNHIQYTARDGDQRDHDSAADIEDYSGHERPDTIRAQSSTFGDGEFHTLQLSYTPQADSFSFMMIIRFVVTSNLDDNWIFLDNFVVEEEQTDVQDWTLY